MFLAFGMRTNGRAWSSANKLTMNSASPKLALRISNHFPTQKREKIPVSSSSVTLSPVSWPSAP